MSESTKVNYLKFELCGASYAVALSDVREVLPMAQLSRPAQMPNLLEGFLNLAARSIPVLRLDRVLDLKSQPPTVDSHLILVNRKTTPFIFVVDRVREVLSVDPSELQTVRDHLSLNNCVVSQIQRGIESIQILNVDSLLLEQERKVVSEFSAAQQKRLLDAWKVAS